MYIDVSKLNRLQINNSKLIIVLSLFLTRGSVQKKFLKISQRILCFNFGIFCKSCTIMK